MGRIITPIGGADTRSAGARISTFGHAAGASGELRGSRTERAVLLPFPGGSFSSTPDPLPALTSASSLHRTARAAADQQLTVAAMYAMLPVAYGKVRCGALLANAFTYSGNWLFWLLWSKGSIDSILDLTLDDKVLPTGSAVTHYATANIPAGDTLGTLGGVDPSLAAAFNSGGQYPTFGETCPGVCYSVVSIPQASLSGPPRFNAKLQGLRLYDPRLDSTNGGTGSQRLADSTTWTFSRNPALVLAHFLTTYDKRSMVWSSVITAANANDATVGTGANTETSRFLDLVLDQENSAQQWVDTLRTAAACWVVPQGDLTKLIPDVGGASVATYAHASGNILDVNGVVLQGTDKLPTVLEIVYTDASQYPVRDLSSTLAKRPGVDAGTTDFRLSTVRMPWITRGTQANREAVERLNKLWLRSIQMDVQLMDEGLKHEPGDLITVTYPDLGLSSLQLRVSAVQPTDDGWALSCMKEDPGVYASTVQPGPTVPSTDLPLPNNPPAVTGLTVVEDVYQVQTGYYGSRLVVTWTLPAWPHVTTFIVTITQAGVIKDTAILPNNSSAYTSIQLPENLSYVVTVGIMSSSDTPGPLATVSITNNGKLAKPSDVPAVNGFEVGGEVRLNWTPATDLDLTAHEIRYSTTAGSWASATLLDRVAAPSVRYTTKAVPPGTWRFWIKGLDSVRSALYPYGQESVNAKSVDVTVTTDSNAFVASSQVWSSPTLFKMTAVADTSGGTDWITDFADTWTTLFPTALSGFTNPLSTYHTAGTSALVTAMVDIGSSVSGTWILNPSYQDLAGTAVVKAEVNNSGGEAGKTITAATNATPIVITATAHGYTSNDEVVITGVLGNTAANGTRRITVLTTNTYSLQDIYGNNIAGNGAYTSGGSSSRWVWQSFNALQVQATARFARMRIETTGTILITDMGSLNVNVVARREGATVTTSASAPTIISFANTYNAAVAANATPQGATAATGTCDNIEVSGGRGVLVGQSLLFNGTSDFVTIPDATALRLSTAMTLEAQVKLTQITGATQGIARKDTETGTRYMWGIQIGISGYLECVYVNASTFIARSLTTPPIGRWMHVAMTISGTTLSCYLDGQLQSTVTISGTQSFPTGRMAAGANPPNVVTGVINHIEFFGGRIDDVRVWNVARTQAQIQAAMNTPLVGNESGLVGYWKFDALSGTVATDSQSNVTANTGTVSGAKWRPLNGMDVYAFNSSGTQIATPVSWLFSGI